MHPRAPEQCEICSPELCVVLAGRALLCSTPGMVPAALGSTAQGFICAAVQMVISKATTSSCLCWEPAFPALQSYFPLGIHLWEFLHLSASPVALPGAGVILAE